MALTPEELEMLTPEERAGLEDPDLVDDAEEEEEEDGEQPGADEAEGDDDKPAGKADEEQPGRDDGADDDKPQDEDLREPLPQIKTEAVADAEAKLADIDKREDSLSEKFEDGELTTTEYRTELRKLERERGDIEKQQLKHELATEHNEAQAEAMWQRDVKQFLDDHPEVVTSKLRMDSFDMVVRAVTAKTMEEGKMPGMADLKKAHAEWSEQLGIQAKAKPDTKKPEPKPAAKQREIPPTLANVPSAEVNSTDDGKWGVLDRLMESDPLRFEKELAKLSESDREAYLAAS